jgi:hypothetical protein
MIVYTGWVGATHGAVADLTRDEVISFVPRGDGRIQTFGEPNWDVDDALAIVSASLSSFGGEPDTAALDDASVNLEIRQFPGIGGQPRVLILRATLAAAGGAVHGFAYQVTVLVHPSQLGEVLRLPRHERA